MNTCRKLARQELNSLLNDLTTNSVNNQGTYNTFSAVTGITVSTSITATGSSATNANLPPYYALAYIMRTS